MIAARPGAPARAKPAASAPFAAPELAGDSWRHRRIGSPSLVPGQTDRAINPLSASSSPLSLTGFGSTDLTNLRFFLSGWPAVPAECPYTVRENFVNFRGLMALDDFLLDAEDKMSKTEQVVVNEFAGVRTGKASPALVENILVEVYGAQMRIRELAGITTPEPRMLSIQPWDANSLHPIEKAIQKSNLGLTPSIQGRAIRLFFPELSEERRQEFVKIVRKMSEDGRVAIRHVRRDAMEQLKKHAHDSGITEDDAKHAEKELQKLTDEYIAKIDQHLASKEKEIMTVREKECR